MQLLNKQAIKNAIAHTWYLYPISITLITLLWIWGFSAFHMPSAHQTISIFIEAEVKNDSLFHDIMNKKYDKEKLRELTISYSSKDRSGYLDKLRIALSTSDIMIFDEDTMGGFINQYEDYLVCFDDYIVDNYLDSPQQYYKFSDEEYGYGILIKEKGVENYLNTYITFDESLDYYLVLSKSSSNLGARYEVGNAYYDNALTYMGYLLKGEL